MNHLKPVDCWALSDVRRQNRHRLSGFHRRHRHQSYGCRQSFRHLRYSYQSYWNYPRMLLPNDCCRSCC